VKTITIEADGHQYRATIEQAGRGWAASITRDGVWCGEMRCADGGEAFQLTASNGGISPSLAPAISDALLTEVAPPKKKRRRKKKSEEDAPEEEAAPQEEEAAPEE